MISSNNQNSFEITEILAIVTIFFLVSGCHIPKQETAPWKRHTIDNSSIGADGVRVADANTDGVMDLV